MLQNIIFTFNSPLLNHYTLLYLKEKERPRNENALYIMSVNVLRHLNCYAHPTADCDA